MFALNRREFIQYCVAGGLAVSAGIASYSWVDAQEGARARAEGFVNDLPGGLSDAERKILYLASLAPSGHNTQPWVVKISEPDTWVIGSDKTRWLPAVDPHNRETMLSIGAFIENLTQAALLYGYQASVEIIGENAFSPQIAKIRLIKQPAVQKSAAAVIEKRRTIRKNLLKTPLNVEDIRWVIGDHNAAIEYFPLDSAVGATISQATLLANKRQAARDDAQTELADWIRWSDAEAHQHGNGLTPESMEMQGPVRWYAKHFLRRDDVLSTTFREETVKLVQEQVQTCAGWLVIKSRDSSPPALIESGRLLQSAWLRTHERLIGFHPMTQALEEELIAAELTKDLRLTGDIQFIIRVGYIQKHLAPVSLRMPISKIIVKS